MLNYKLGAGLCCAAMLAKYGQKVHPPVLALTLCCCAHVLAAQLRPAAQAC